jgi:hypothetical protein
MMPKIMSVRIGLYEILLKNSVVYPVLITAYGSLLHSAAVKQNAVCSHTGIVC